MQIVAVWITIVLVYSSRVLVVGDQAHYINPLSSQRTTFSDIGYSEKRAHIAEPTCEELRAMWRYSKRQSRAAEATNDLPMYRDPFSYNMWESYPSRSHSWHGYRENHNEPARTRSGGVPIYGKVIHKAPSNGRLRNGMSKAKAFEELTKTYGTVNRQPPTSQRVYTYRIGGGMVVPQSGNVPQAGSFQHLKELILTERARELQEQRRAEEIAARAAVFKERTIGERQQNENYLTSLYPYEGTKNVNYDINPPQYVSDVNLGETLLPETEKDDVGLDH
ncbi:uncharacterized protein LOC127278772 isoform X2 [Leptopilina boulardi]|uniref:uncharacterized protein LOC127278772 isoform X2 n=1 Tax=Leptopilina boulardi TaxID=63433 RepID=UPI0021F5CDB3|nr:uncharacterized protein LOC127278772 isoform X2 [Leptopilina boulardi]